MKIISDFNRLLRPRWRKILSDLWNNKARTVVVVLSIAVGTFAVGLVSSAYIILSSDVNADYLSVNPHAAVISSSSFDDDMVSTLKQIDGVSQVMGRNVLSVRIYLNEEKKLPISIIAVSDTHKMEMDRLRPITPDNIPELNDHEILIESSSLTGLKVKTGDILKVEMRNKLKRELKVVGIVNDLTITPYTFTGSLSGYVNDKTLVWLGANEGYNQVSLRTPSSVKTQSEVTQIAQSVSDKMEKNGLTIYKTVTSTPGKHYASDFIDGMGALLGFLGVLAILLSGFLTVNSITAIMGQQIRQIGIMKTYGGQASQLIRMYIILALCFGGMALIIALPLSAFMAYQMADILATFLNFRINAFRIPVLSVLLQVFVALLVPVAAALVPVINGVKISIRAAINGLSVSTNHIKHNRMDRLIENIQNLPRPLLLSLRNVFRRKGRLILALSALVLGGSIFIAVFNLRSALNAASDQALGYYLSDVSVNFSHPYRRQEIEKYITGVPSVVSLEGWGAVSAQVLSADESTSEDIAISAPPANSKMIVPAMTGGRWLQAGEQNVMVISNHLLKKRPDLKTGDIVTVKIKGKKYDWKIVGTCSIPGQLPIPLVYTNNEYLEVLTDSLDVTSEYHIETWPHDPQTQTIVAKAVEKQLKSANLAVSKISTGSDLSSRVLVLINLMVIMLLSMAVLIALVGGLGLMGMMSQNVFDRTREIGVMRAIGADNKSIQQLVIVEGLFIGILSWIFSLVLQLPFSLMLESAVGVPVVGAALPVVLLAPEGPVIWLLIVSILSSLASFLPARNASALTIREILNYE